jgi:hypothetical protein
MHILACLLLSLALAGSATPQVVKPEFLLFETPKAPGKIVEAKMRMALQLAAQELHVSGELPTGIYLFHIGMKEMEASGVDVTSVWKTLRGGGFHYELWIVGEPTDEKYGALAVSLLKDSFSISLDPNEAKRLKDIVAKKLSNCLVWTK